MNNPSISLRIFDENNEMIHQTNDNGDTKANIIKININRHAAIKPIKNKAIKLNQLMKSHSDH